MSTDMTSAWDAKEQSVDRDGGCVPGPELTAAGDGGAETVAARNVDKLDVPDRKNAQECLISNKVLALLLQLLLLLLLTIIIIFSFYCYYYYFHTSRWVLATGILS
jgi:hypothetical protein